MGFLMPPHPLTTFEIQNYYQKEPDLTEFIQKIICLKKISDAAYVLNLDECAEVGTHWIALFF